jgi:hypothetical protein
MEIFFLVIMYLVVSLMVTLLFEMATERYLGPAMTPASARRSIGFGLLWPVSVPYVFLRTLSRACFWLVSDLPPFSRLKKPE